MSYQTVIDAARLSIGDPGKVRYPDENCLVFAVDGVREIAIGRADLFSVVGEVPCTPGDVRQSVAGVKGLHIIDVQGVKGGNGITRADLDTIRQYHPSWMNDAAGPAQNWFPISQDQARLPLRDYYIYPKAPNAQVMIVHYVVDPILGVTPVLTDTPPIPDELQPALEWYVVFRAEAEDEEHVNTGRAAQAYQMFAGIVGLDRTEWLMPAANARA